MILNFKNLETVNVGDVLHMIGGFSISYNDDPNDNDTGESNNCMGGNCAEGCGGYGNYNKLCTTNNVAGCG